MGDSSVEKVKTRRLKKKKPVLAEQAEQVEQAVVVESAKKKKPRKKKENVVKPAAKMDELKQGEHVVDYQRLHDALRESFSIDETRGDIHFAPLINKSSKKYEKTPTFSMSNKTNTSESRNCNQSAPSAKSKYHALTAKKRDPIFSHTTI